MGLTPIPPPPADCFMAEMQLGPRLRSELGGRRSLLPHRRRRAHRACRTLIKIAEAQLGLRPDPWAYRPEPGGLPPARPAGKPTTL